MTTTTTRPCWHCGTRHESDTMPALCSDPCREAWNGRYQLAYAGPSEILDGPVSPSLVEKPVTAAAVEVRIVDEREPSTLDDQDQAVLAQLCDADLRTRERAAVLQIHSAGCLGYVAPSDEWVDETLTPLSPSLQRAASDLARAGQLPEFAEWFPAPAEDKRDFPTDEPRPADEPQDLVDHAILGHFSATYLPECPPRPPEPPVTERTLCSRCGSIQHNLDDHSDLKWWLGSIAPIIAQLLDAARRWFSRG